MRHAPAPACPYKGLEPYEEADLGYFFGRGDDAQRIANALMIAPLTVLYGKSGVGKSSVLQAAVPPRLRDPENTLVLLWNAWQSPAFLDDLLAALLEEAKVERSGVSLDQVLPELAGSLGRPLALIFDQFEEYFHYSEGPRDDFEQQLARVANSGHDDIHILLSLRDDGLASLDRLRRRIPQILQSRLELKHLTEDGARQAIDGPLSVFNDAHRTKITIDPALRDRIIGEVSSRDPGGEVRIETAYLQLALTKLWEASGGAQAKTLSVPTFDRLGGAKDIARQHLEDVLEQLTLDERSLAMVLFDRLVTPSGGKIALSARALAGYAESAKAIAGYAESDEPTVTALLQRLTRRESRLLRPVPSPDDPTVQGFELFHDVLGQPARAWLERESEARKRAAELEEQRQRSLLLEEQRTQALLAQSRAMTSMAHDELEHRSPRTAVLLALRGLPDGTTDRPLFEPAQAALYRAVLRDWEELALIGHGGTVNAVAFDPSRSRLATNSDDGARIWDSETGDLLQTLEGQGLVLAVAFDPSGKRLATGSADRTARIWNSETGDLLQTLKGHEDWVRGVAFDRSGKRLASASDDATARIWSSETGDLLQTLKGHGGWVRAVAFDPSGKRLATSSHDGTARIWSSETGELLQTLKGQGLILAVAFDHAGERLASASSDRMVRIWNSETGNLLQLFKGHGDTVNAVAFDPTGKRLATGSDDGTARIWSSERGELLQSFKGHGGGVKAVTLHSSGKRMATGSDDGTARIWSSDTGMLVQLLQEQGPINAVAFDHAGERLASASSDRMVRIWNSETGNLLQTLAGHRDWVRGVAFDPSGKRLASVSDDATARIWDSETGELLKTLEGHGGWVRAVAFDPSGKRLATSSDDGTARIWDSETGELLQTLDGQGGEVNAVPFDLTGKRLATGSFDGTARIWNSETGELLQALEGHGVVLAVAFDPTGKRLATGSFDRAARIWDSETGKLLQTLEGHGGWVRAVAFDPSGERLATGATDDTARIWSCETGELLQLLEGHGGDVNAVAFDPTGKRLATASDDGTARIWHVFQDLGELVTFAKRGHRRLCFTEVERKRYFIPDEEGCIERTPGRVDAEVTP